MLKNISVIELENWIKDVRPYVEKGKVASYIPALQEQDPKNVAMSIHYLDNHSISAGQTETLFTLQSVSKVIALALALIDKGEDLVFEKVGMEPSADPFYSIVKLETTHPSKPLNPMINAGALAVSCLIEGASPYEKINRLLDFTRQLAGDQTINYNKKVADSEFESSFLNRSLAYFMKQSRIVTSDVEELLSFYTKQCAIELNIAQLARIGAVLANNGKDLTSDTQIIPEHYARICKTFMVTCGMYDASGSFAIKVGIPAKSGVSGAIMGSVKELGGIAVFGPSLDEKGNSVAGFKLMRKIANQLHLSIF